MSCSNSGTTEINGPLSGIRILDLSRILAAPAAAQMLGDMGADVVKVEHPVRGDDTRGWGPPFLKDGNDEDTGESAYYLSANRNKRSVALDFTTDEGRETLVRLIARADIVLENFRTGGLAKYGLDHAAMRARFPRLIWASLTGFGQTGPEATRAGYDFLIQGMGGIMSLTGEPGTDDAPGEPMKTGVAIADLMAGQYMAVAVLAALHHRSRTGEGQHIDLSLLDCQAAWLSNAGQYYLTSGEVTPRMGNAHPAIVPYQTFRASDGHVILAVGNDAQFARFCAVAGRPDLATDARFATNQARVRNREVLVPVVAGLIAERTRDDWIACLECEGVPCGPVNRVDEVFALPQIAAREMVVEMAHPATSAPVRLIASPLKFSGTPVRYRHPPPMLGQHTDEVLAEWLEDAEDGATTYRGKTHA